MWLGKEISQDKAIDTIDMAFLNESILFHFLCQSLPQIVVQATNSYLTETLSDSAIFSITLSFLTTLNGVYKYGYYIFCLGKTIADVPASIELPNINSLMARNPIHHTESNSEETITASRICENGKPEDLVWEILLHSGIADIIHILVENKISNLHEFQSSDMKQLVLNKYKDNKTNEEYQNLMYLFNEITNDTSKTILIEV